MEARLVQLGGLNIWKRLVNLMVEIESDLKYRMFRSHHESNCQKNNSFERLFIN